MLVETGTVRFQPVSDLKPVFGGSRKHFCCFTRTFSRRTITAEVGKLGEQKCSRNADYSR